MSETFNNNFFGAGQSSTGLYALNTYTGTSIASGVEGVTVNGSIDQPNSTVQLDLNLAGVTAVGATGTYLGFNQPTGVVEPTYFFRVTGGGLVTPVTIAVSNGTVPALSLLTPVNTANVTAPDSPTLPCFCAGTLIRTERGDVPVEELSIGDVLVTADGRTRPVKWIGYRTVASAFADRVNAYPIRVAEGAIAEGIPARDLFLSPDHALLIDGVLVQAGALVNGTTVTRVANPEPRFTYFHVETEDHAVILAEAAPAETFVSNMTRRGFDNYADYVALFGQRAEFEAMADRDEPRAMSARQVPRGIRARLAARAACLRPAESVAA